MTAALYMSIRDVSGVVGWCLGAYSAVENTYVHRLHTFLHTGSGLYNPLQHTRIVPRPHILYNISTTLYNTLQHSTTLYSLQLYSISTVYNLYNTPLAPAHCCTEERMRRYRDPARDRVTSVKIKMIIHRRKGLSIESCQCYA